MSLLTVKILPPPLISATIGGAGGVAVTISAGANIRAGVSAAVPVLSSSSALISETPQGAINGSNATFTTAPFQVDSLAIWINGVLLSTPGDYITTGTSTILFTESPHVGDVILARFTPL
jgi:hypothetical protein